MHLNLAARDATALCASPTRSVTLSRFIVTEAEGSFLPCRRARRATMTLSASVAPALADALALCYKALMRTVTRLVAAMQLALIFPAALFMTAVLVGVGDPPQYDLARIAQRIVMWYSARLWTLWLLLLALPFAVLVSGAVTLVRNWNRSIELPYAVRQSLATMIPAHLATLFVAGTTLTSAGILAIVVLHMLAN